METYTVPEQSKSIPQGRKIQNGDTRNHQDVPQTRGVGYLNKFQGRLLPHTNTGTIQEISEISHPGLDIPVQGTAICIVHNTHGVHCNSKGGETDSYEQGYKDPPIPRRLVGESQIPPYCFQQTQELVEICQKRGWMVNLWMVRNQSWARIHKYS